MKTQNAKRRDATKALKRRNLVIAGIILQVYRSLHMKQTSLKALT